MKVVQSCLTLCNPMDHTVHGILQARILEQIVFPSFRGSSQPRDWTQVYPHCRYILYPLSHKGSHEAQMTVVGTSLPMASWRRCVELSHSWSAGENTYPRLEIKHIVKPWALRVFCYHRKADTCNNSGFFLLMQFKYCLT